MYNPKNEMYVKVVCDSITPNGQRIVTFHAHYPRIIHGEIMTHRMFSRNARSSRAVPVKTMLQEIMDKPFIPWHWGKNMRGMQATEENNSFVEIPLPYLYEGYDYSKIEMEDTKMTRETAWLWARDQAVIAAQAFSNAEYHKQIANRLIEPFAWIDTLITTTDLSNFYHLRNHDDAEPHFHDLAILVKEAVDASTPKLLNEGEWHMPYVTDEEKEILERHNLLKISVARCARISYTPFDGNPSLERELERYDLLVGSEPLHASPCEHQAKIDTIFADKGGNLGPGFIQYRKLLNNECFKGIW